MNSRRLSRARPQYCRGRIEVDGTRSTDREDSVGPGPGPGCGPGSWPDPVRVGWRRWGVDGIGSTHWLVGWWIWHWLRELLGGWRVLLGGWRVLLGGWRKLLRGLRGRLLLVGHRGARVTCTQKQYNNNTIYQNNTAIQNSNAIQQNFSDP